jgi:hypothetical protein
VHNKIEHRNIVAYGGFKKSINVSYTTEIQLDQSLLQKRPLLPDAIESESKHAKDTQQWLHPPSIETSNRFSALMEADSADRQHNADPEHPPKPPPIYIQDVTTIPLLLQLLEQVAPRKYETKALANNKVKVQPTISDSYGAIIKALAEKMYTIPYIQTERRSHLQSSA